MGNNKSQLEATEAFNTLLDEVNDKKEFAVDWKLVRSPVLFDKVIHALEDNWSITRLVISATGVHEKQVVSIAKLLKANNCVKELQVMCTKFPEHGAKILADVLQESHSITHVSFWGHTYVGLGHVIEAITSRVNTLGLNQVSIGVTEVSLIAKLLQKTVTLSHLHLFGNKFGAEGAKALVEGLKVNSSLQQLSIGSNDLGPYGTQLILDALKDNTTLTRLDISDNHLFGRLGGSIVADFLVSHENLKEIDLSCNMFDIAGLLPLCEALKVCHVQKLNLGNNNLGSSKVVESLYEALEANRHLTHLTLCRASLNGEGFDTICRSLLKNDRITYLDLSFNHVGNSGAIADLIRTSKSITFLNLMNVGFRASAAFCEALKVTRCLKKLDLSSNVLLSENTNSFLEGLRANRSITHIYLGDNSIHNDTFKVICKMLEENQTIKLVRFNCNRIQFDGLAGLKELLRVNSTLTSISLYNNSFREEVDFVVDSICSAFETNFSIRELSGVSPRVDALCARNRRMHQLAQASVVVLMCIRKFRRTHLNDVPKEVVAMIADELLKIWCKK